MAIGGPVGKGIFNLVTNFKFEIGGALAESNKLNNSLKGISENAQAVQNSLKFNIIGASLQLTGLQGGVLGVMQGLVSASEEFYDSQLKLSTLLSGNTRKLQTYNIQGKKVPLTSDFNQIQKISGSLLRDVGKDAKKYGIHSSDFTHTFNDLNALLVPKGAAGKNLEQSRKMTRNLLLGSDVLGLTPAQANWQIQTLLQGSAMEGRGLFNRLKLETDEFKNISASGFNRLMRQNPQKAIEKINKAFDQYLEKPGILEARMRKLSVQFTKLNEIFKGMNSPLRNLGDTMRNVMIDSLIKVNQWLDKNIKQISDALGSVFKYITSDIEQFYLQLNKTATLSKSYGGSYNLTFIIALFTSIIHTVTFMSTVLPNILLKVGVTGVALNKITLAVRNWPGLFGKLAVLMMGMVRFMGAIAGVGLLKAMFKFRGQLLKGVTFLLKAFTQFALAWGAVFALFRVYDSAKAQAEIMDLKGLKSGELGVALKDLVQSFKNLLAPFVRVIDAMGSMVAHLMSLAWWVDKVNKVLGGQTGKVVMITEKIGDAITRALNIVYVTTISIFKGIAHTISSLFNFPGLANFNQGFLKIFRQARDQYSALDPAMERRRKEIRDFHTPERFHHEKYAQSNNYQIYNNPKFEIRNQFPENVEPDRIATAIIDEIGKSTNAQVDSRASTLSLQGGYLGT